MLKRRWPLFVVLLAVACVYSNSIGNEFHFDDFHTVVENPAVRSLANLKPIFSDASAFSVEPANQTYRPVVTASLAVDYALGHGYNVLWFHLSSLMWFMLLLVVLDLFCERLLDVVQPGLANRWLALGVTAWFGMHPAMAETVNYVVQRADLYCTLGCVAALWIFVRWPKLRRTGVYLLPFVVAMLSKPTAAVFPVLLGLYVFYFETAEQVPWQRWKSSLIAVLPALVVTAALLGLQSAMTPSTFMPGILPAAAYRWTQPYVWLRYFGALLLPIHLNVDTDLDPFTGMTMAAISGVMFVAALIIAVCVASRRRRLYPIAFGLAWFIVTQVPTSLYVLSEVENDHRMFFSFPGLMLAVVWAMYLAYAEITAKSTHRLRLNRAITGAAVCCLLAYGLGAHRRNAVWRSEETLWADDVAKCPQNGRGLMIYGETKMKAGDLEGAQRLFESALQFTPNYALLELNLAIVDDMLAAQGESHVAGAVEEHFRRAVDLAASNDLTHAYYGQWLMSQGRGEEARTELRMAFSLNPRRPMGRDLLLRSYVRMGDLGTARSLAGEVIKVAPDDHIAAAIVSGEGTGEELAADTHLDASQAAYLSGRFQISIDEAQKALEIDPHSAPAWNNIGVGYGGLREWKRGMEAERRALELNPRLEVARNNLRLFRARETVQEMVLAPLEEVPRFLQDDPSKTAADWVDLSEGLFQARRYEASLTAAQKAVQLEPLSAEAWNNISANEQALQRWDEAISASQKALRIRPDYPLALHNLEAAVRNRSTAHNAKIAP